jgi:predicted nucleic acid-binding protein
VKTYWDSSALLAAVISDEPHHAAANAALATVQDDWSTPHALAECFATLTGGRKSIQLTPANAMQIIEVNFLPRLSLWKLTPADYLTAMRKAQAAGARGGALYDLLHLQAARQLKAQRIYTLNVRHFQAFAPDLANCICAP